MRLLPIHETQARRILSPVSGFLAQAGFTHSLSPARNCTYGCSYCYVPTMRVQGGLRPEDWQHWGEYTVYKRNAAELLRRELRAGMVIYCSPLTDPYQLAEATQQMMPDLLEALYFNPPEVFVLQTRGTLVYRDARLLLTLAERTRVRISYSITTNDDRIRKIFEPRCEPIGERLDTLRALRELGLEVHATVAPILPCEPAELAKLVVEASGGAPVIGDPLHVRQTKPRGATTREAALKILDHYEQPQWAESAFQEELVRVMEEEIRKAGAEFVTGPEGFRCLTQN